MGYAPQIIEDCADLSGGECFNRALTEVVNQNLNILLLDGLTNHLDQQNRKWRKKRLSDYSGTLIVISHTQRSCVVVQTRCGTLNMGKFMFFPGTMMIIFMKRNGSVRPLQIS